MIFPPILIARPVSPVFLTPSARFAGSLRVGGGDLTETCRWEPTRCTKKAPSDRRWCFCVPGSFHSTVVLWQKNLKSKKQHLGCVLRPAMANNRPHFWSTFAAFHERQPVFLFFFFFDDENMRAANIDLKGFTTRLLAEFVIGLNVCECV